MQAKKSSEETEPTGKMSQVTLLEPHITNKTGDNSGLGQGVMWDEPLTFLWTTLFPLMGMAWGRA